MDNKTILTFIGGDKRQYYAMDIAVKKGIRLKPSGLKTWKTRKLNGTRI